MQYRIVHKLHKVTGVTLSITFLFFLWIVGKVIGDTILYFGCRKKAEDFIYEEELNEYVQNGVLTVSYLMTDLNQILTKCHSIGSSCILFLLLKI